MAVMSRDMPRRAPEGPLVATFLDDYGEEDAATTASGTAAMEGRAGADGQKGDVSRPP